MSAVRRGDRRTNRSNLSSPYARPTPGSNKVQPPKKSGWSLSGLLNFLNPFGGGSSELEEDDDHSEDDDLTVIRRSPPVPILRRQPSPPPPPTVQPPPQLTIRQSAVNGETAESSHPSHSSRRQSSFSFPSPTPAGSNSSLAKHLEPVTRFLVEKAGHPLNEFEAAGIVDYIQKNVQGSSSNLDRPEPFRFSTSPSRSLSPNSGQTDGDAGPPRKTLSRNPNGVYRWQGAGSSRPRNRYQSPGFAPRPQHPMKLSSPKTPLTTDTKRRRVGDEAGSSTPQKAAVPSTSTVVFPISGPESAMEVSQHVGSSATVPNGKAPVPLTFGTVPPVTPKANGIQPRIRTAALPLKSTTPAIPSPLRQAWKDSDSPPQASPPSRPTRAADFMTELIKEVTPTKKPDVSNPYQTASPVKPPAPARKPVLKRPKPAPKPVEEPMEKEPETSAQAIIEATVPKGTKRSRPPKMEQPTRGEDMMDSEPSPPALNGYTQPVRFPGVVRTTVETITIVEEGESPTKRRKTPTLQPPVKIQAADETSHSMGVIRPAEIIEPTDDAARINGKVTPLAPAPTLSPPPAQKPLFGGAKASAPKEPSKLRYSYQADKVEVKGSEAVTSPQRFPSFFVPPMPAPAPSVPAPAPGPAKAKLSPKEEALAMDVDKLPMYTFTPATTTSYVAGPSTSAARNAVLAMSVTGLPTYEFKPVTAPVRAMNGFNWTAAGLKAPATVGQAWKCMVCDLQNPASAKEKCTICDAPREASTNMSSSSPAPKLTPSPPTPPAPSAPSVPVKAFDWTAAGMASKPKPADGTWNCHVCTLSNPASAMDKCTICDAPR